MEIFTEVLRSTFSEIYFRDIFEEISFQIFLIGIIGTFLADIAVAAFCKENNSEICKR